MARQASWNIREKILKSGKIRFTLNLAASANRGTRARLTFPTREAAEDFVRKHRAARIQPPVIKGRRIDIPKVQLQRGRWVVDLTRRLVGLAFRSSTERRRRQSFPNHEEALVFSQQCRDAALRNLDDARHAEAMSLLAEIDRPRLNIQTAIAAYAYTPSPPLAQPPCPHRYREDLENASLSLRALGVDLLDVARSVTELRTGSVQQVDFWRNRLTDTLEDLDLILNWSDLAMRPRALDILYRLAVQACDSLATLASHPEKQVAELVAAKASQEYCWPTLTWAIKEVQRSSHERFMKQVPLASKLPIHIGSDRGRRREFHAGQLSLAQHAFSVLEAARRRFQTGTLRERRLEQSQLAGWRRAAAKLRPLSIRTCSSWISVAVQWSLDPQSGSLLCKKVAQMKVTCAERSVQAWLKRLLGEGFRSMIGKFGRSDHCSIR